MTTSLRNPIRARSPSSGRITHGVLSSSPSVRRWASTFTGGGLFLGGYSLSEALPVALMAPAFSFEVR